MGVEDGPFDAVLFDGDGTLWDAVKIGRFNFIKTVEVHLGTTLSEDQLLKTAGHIPRDAYAMLGFSPDIVIELLAIHQEIQVANAHLILPFKNSRKTLETIKLAGLKTGLVTSRDGPTLPIILESSGLMPFLDTVVSAYQTKRRKPHPEPVNVAMERLEVTDPTRVAMFGDTFLDIWAAQAAGVEAVGVSYGEDGHDLARYTNRVIDDISESVGILLGR